MPQEHTSGIPDELYKYHCETVIYTSSAVRRVPLISSGDMSNKSELKDFYKKFGV